MNKKIKNEEEEKQREERPRQWPRIVSVVRVLLFIVVDVIIYICRERESAKEK